MSTSELQGLQLLSFWNRNIDGNQALMDHTTLAKFDQWLSFLFAGNGECVFSSVYLPWLPSNSHDMIAFSLAFIMASLAPFAAAWQLLEAKPNRKSSSKAPAQNKATKEPVSPLQDKNITTLRQVQSHTFISSAIFAASLEDFSTPFSCSLASAQDSGKSASWICHELPLWHSKMRAQA